MFAVIADGEFNTNFILLTIGHIAVRRMVRPARATVHLHIHMRSSVHLCAHAHPG